MQTLRTLAVASALALGLAASQQAAAVTVNSNGDSFTVLFSDGIVNATARFLVTDWDTTLSGGTDATFDVALDNNSSGSYRLVGLGVRNLTPNPDTQSADDGWNASGNGSEFTETNPDTALELCFYDNNGCSNGTDGVGAGSEDSFDFFLDFGTQNALTSAGLTFTGFIGRFREAVGSSSSRLVTGCISASSGVSLSEGEACRQSSTSVPEPTTLALFSLGLLGLGFGFRRQLGR